MRKQLLFFCWLALLSQMAWASVQPVICVDRNLLFLPHDGVALDGRTGHLAWRHARFDGQTTTDGHGLLLVGWLAAARSNPPALFTRICRLRTSDGASLWCQNFDNMMEWQVDAQGGLFYVLSHTSLFVGDLTDGQASHVFSLPYSTDRQLQTAPSGGVWLLENVHDGTALSNFRPGGNGFTHALLPTGIHAFRGETGGVLFYSQVVGRFWSPPAAELLAGMTTSGGDYPRTALNRQGFIVAAGEASKAELHGGIFGGNIWQAALASGNPLLGLSASMAYALATAGTGAAAIADLTALDLASGQPRFERHVEGAFTSLRALGGDLLLEGGADLRLLDATSGADRWRNRLPPGEFAAAAEAAIVFWAPGGELAALDRATGAELWRVHFALPK